MKLFEIVPWNFFSILSSQNREIYYDALMVLHDMFTYELNIRVEEYISALIGILEDRVFALEDEEDAQENGSTPSSRARMILNRLLKTGWVDKEFMDASFIEIITPRSYAIPILKALSDLGDQSIQEYNSLVYSTFSALRQAMSDGGDHMYEAILAARGNTEQLQYSLRSLYHGIRGFLRGIVEQHDVNLLLQDHFSAYKELSDRVYHPIKTMDSVHRYMGPIQNLLSDILASEELLRSMQERAMGIRNYDDEGKAMDEILKAIDFVMDFYRSVGNLVSEIDRKHSNYTKSSIEKIQYIMTADQSIKGNLTEVLKAYASSHDREREGIARIMDKHIHAYHQEFFDAASLYRRSLRSRYEDRVALSVEAVDSMSEVAERLLRQHIQHGYPQARIVAFVERLLAGRDAIASADIHIGDDTAFILLILAVVRQKESGMAHVIDYFDGQVVRNGYTIPNMFIRRKVVRSRVE